MEHSKNYNPQISTEIGIQSANRQPLKRIDSHYISHELLHLFHLDKGFFFNFKQLILRPGASIKEFITEDRSRHMKPIGFLIFSALLYTLVYNYFKPMNSTPETESYFYGSYVKILQDWTSKNFGYTYILTSFFTAAWTRLFFRKYGFNYFEIMTLLCFVSGQGMLIIAFILPFHSYLTMTANTIILLSTTILYTTIVTAQFFDRTKIINYVKALITYFLGKLSFSLVLIGMGYTIDFIKSLF